jgi:spermidine synthase
MLLFVSGACALIYQVVWARMFTQIFGSTIYSVSVVLAAFMSGLAIGSNFLGKLADRSNNPLRLYGLYEVGIGVSALAVLLIFTGLTPVYLWLYDTAGHSVMLLSAGRFILAFCLIIIPTILMGATLPILARFATHRIEELGLNVAGLYSVNTAGAIMGSLLAGFFLIRIFGIHVATYLAATANIMTGILAYWLSRFTSESANTGEEVQATNRGSYAVHASAARDHRIILWVLAISGFTAFAYEIYWTRALILVVGSSTYAFVTILSSFLTGIALGGWAVRMLLDRIRNPLLVFGWIEIAIGLTAAATIPLILFFTNVDILKNFIANIEGNWDLVLAIRFLTSFAVMLVPSILIGATFPLVVRIYADQLQNAGADVGRVYAVNTLGNIAGAIIPAFIILPLIGISQGILVMAVLNITAGAFVLASMHTVSGRVRATVPVFSLAFIMLAIFIPTKLKLASGETDKDITLYYKEGVAATTRVIASRTDRQLKHMIVDGSRIGGTGVVDFKQQILAHLPVLLNKDAKSHLSIGLGSGILIGESARHESIERQSVVEIAPSVVEGSDYFSEENGNIKENTRIDIEVNDGVNYLLTNNASYDIITSDAKSKPEFGSNGVFYSRDYYDLVRKNLSSNGVFVQWVPLYLPHKHYRSVLKTFTGSFPHASLWFIPPGNSFLVGLREPLQVDYAYVNDMLKDVHQPLDGLRNYGITSADELLSHYIAGEEVIKHFVADADINSLERPVIEFYSLRDYAVPATSRRVDNLSFIIELGKKTTDSTWVTNLSHEDMAGLADARQAEGYYVAGFKRVMESGPGEYAQIRHYFDSALEKSPANNDIRHHIMSGLVSMARVSINSNELQEAEKYAREATRVSDIAAEANCLYGMLLASRGEQGLALKQLKACVESRPMYVSARKALANIYLRIGNKEAAAEQRRILEELQ